MRGAAVAAALALALAGCSGVTPGTPMAHGANEMQPRPGLFTGPTGDALIFGERPAPAAP